MQTQGQIAAAKLKPFVEETLAPRVCRMSHPLAAEVFQTPDRMSPEQAAQAAYHAVSIGWRWGPLWSTAWFRIRGTVPPGMASHRVCLHFSSGTEALLWKDGMPHHGFDANRSTVVLFPSARGGEHVDLLIEAACNHVLGTTQLFWEPPEQNERWKETEPGRFEHCELVTVDQDAWRLMRTFEFARLLLEQQADNSPRIPRLRSALERIASHGSLSGTDPQRTLAEIRQALDRADKPAPTCCWSIGHAHLDTAWLWPIAETKRKVLRTFANSLRLMERFPGYRFLASQPQQYAWLKESSPSLFEQVRARVKEGRWEPQGTMWIEPDGNLPSGESFVRQIIHGARFFETEFGIPQRIAYLPDTFGFAASLPQIFRLAGLDTFITNKLWWNQTNEFPHIHFRWRGIDGTTIRSHLTPGQEYNATNTPADLLKGQRNIARKKARPYWFQPFGYGDGGGGPTDWQILYAQLSDATEGMPRINTQGIRDFCDALRQAIPGDLEEDRFLPTWDGELYLERHRGTYTTQAAVKKGNAIAEASLRIAEWLSFAGPSRQTDDDRAGTLAQLDTAWKLTLLNQFHDILPGSSIGEVYKDAARDHAAVRATCDEVERRATREWLAAADTTGFREPVLVFNPGSSDASGWVTWELADHSRRAFATEVPAMGFRVIEAADHGQELPATPDDILDNGILSARIDRRGRITALNRRGVASVAADRGLNELVLYDDNPTHWDAWEVDEDYLAHAHSIEADADRWERRDEPGRHQVIIERSLGRASRLVQTLTLDAHSHRLDIHTIVDWHEEHTLLRALFNTRIKSTHATYEIPFGHFERPTTRDTPIDKAKFEVPAHRWMDLSEPGRGLALLNDCKYGHSCLGPVMGLSLLRAPKWPDPEADIGGHEFTYSLMPHNGDWRAAGVDREAERMVRPMWAIPTAPGHRGACGASWAPLRLSGTAAVRIAAIKPAESGDARTLIVRLVEGHGRAGACRIDWALPVSDVQGVDLRERPLALPISHHAESRTTSFTIKPFQIITLAVSLAN